jgi:hypothetical protein
MHLVASRLTGLSLMSITPGLSAARRESPPADEAAAEGEECFATLRGTMIEPPSGVSGGPIQNPSPLASRASAARPEFACR